MVISQKISLCYIKKIHILLPVLLNQHFANTLCPYQHSNLLQLKRRGKKTRERGRDGQICALKILTGSLKWCGKEMPGIHSLQSHGGGVGFVSHYFQPWAPTEEVAFTSGSHWSLKHNKSICLKISQYTLVTWFHFFFWLSWT